MSPTTFAPLDDGDGGFVTVDIDLGSEGYPSEEETNRRRRVRQFGKQMYEGIPVIKYDRKGGNSKRILFCDSNGVAVSWKALRPSIISRKVEQLCDDAKGMCLADVSEIRMGQTSPTEVIARVVGSSERGRCVSLVWENRTLDLQTENRADAQALARGLALMVDHAQRYRKYVEKLDQNPEALTSKVPLDPTSKSISHVRSPVAPAVSGTMDDKRFVGRWLEASALMKRIRNWVGLDADGSEGGSDAAVGYLGRADSSPMPSASRFQQVVGEGEMQRFRSVIWLHEQARARLTPPQTAERVGAEMVSTVLRSWYSPDIGTAMGEAQTVLTVAGKSQGGEAPAPPASTRLPSQQPGVLTPGRTKGSVRVVSLNTTQQGGGVEGAVEGMMTAAGEWMNGGGGASAEADLATLEALKTSHPNNIAAKVFDRAYYNSLDEEGKAALLKCLQSGIQNADSGMGCYANQPADYDRFKPFFSKALVEYHGVAEDAKHVSDWTLPEGVSYDVQTLGLGPLSMRTRVGRNLADFPLPGSMTKADRRAMENKMSEAFNVLIGMPEYGGRYYSITPNHPNFINEEKYQELVKAHIMFKDMAADSYLTSAGIAGDWPHGRGCYVSEDKGFIIWVGEEDHLRIMCMAKSTKIESVFNRLKVALDVVSGIPGLAFAFSEDYGNVTSCPTNLGTGMRSSVHIQLPNLTQDGTDAKAKAICKPLGLSVRGLGGEHTPIGSDGTVDISPSARFCIKERDIVQRLFQGLSLLVLAEKGDTTSWLRGNL